MSAYKYGDMYLLLETGRFRIAPVSVAPPPPPEVGWTDLDALINSAPYTASRVVYVSSSTGSDETGAIYSPASVELNGTPTNPDAVAPYATLSAAWAQIRDGNADVLLLRRGDTWAENLFTNKAGASTSARIIVAAYGNLVRARPIVGQMYPGNASTAANQIHAHYKTVLPVIGDYFALGSAVQFEGVQVEGPDTGGSPVMLYDITGGVDLSRCGFKRVRVFSGANVGRANMTFDDNVLWHPDGYVPVSGQEHNNYFDSNTGDIISRRNISANSPGVGFRQRGLGTIEANLILNCSLSSFDIGVTEHFADISLQGTYLDLRYNVALHTPGQYSLYDIKNAIIEENILNGQWLTYWQNTGNTGIAPTTDVVVQDNILYNTQIIGGAGHMNAIEGPYLIRRNDFQRPAGGALINAQSDDFTYEANNRFYSSSSTSDWFNGYTTSYAAYVPARGSNTQVAYTDPNRNLITYMQTLGVTPASAEEAIEWFINGVPEEPTLAGAMNNRLGAWDSRFTATAVINYVRAGFNKSSVPDDLVSPPAPPPPPVGYDLAARVAAVPFTVNLPTLPNITSEVVCDTEAEITASLAVNGRRTIAAPGAYTFGALSIGGTDKELVFQEGASFNLSEFQLSSASRVRVVEAVLNATGQYGIRMTASQDIRFENLVLEAADGGFFPNGVSRFMFLTSVIRAFTHVAYLDANNSDMTIANSDFWGTQPAAGGINGWCIRWGVDSVPQSVLMDSRFRCQQNVTLRYEVDQFNGYFARNQIEGDNPFRTEGRDSGTPAAWPLQNLWFEDNYMYSIAGGACNVIVTSFPRMSNVNARRNRTVGPNASLPNVGFPSGQVGWTLEDNGHITQALGGIPEFVLA